MMNLKSYRRAHCLGIHRGVQVWPRWLTFAAHRLGHCASLATLRPLFHHVRLKWNGTTFAMTETLQLRVSAGGGSKELWSKRGLGRLENPKDAHLGRTSIFYNNLRRERKERNQRSGQTAKPSQNNVENWRKTRNKKGSKVRAFH